MTAISLVGFAGFEPTTNRLWGGGFTVKLIFTNINSCDSRFNHQCLAKQVLPNVPERIGLGVSRPTVYNATLTDAAPHSEYFLQHLHPCCDDYRKKDKSILLQISLSFQATVRHTRSIIVMRDRIDSQWLALYHTISTCIPVAYGTPPKKRQI